MILQKFKGEEGILRLIWQVGKQGSPLVSLEPRLDLAAPGPEAWDLLSPGDPMTWECGPDKAIFAIHLQRRLGISLLPGVEFFFQRNWKKLK